MKVLSRALGIVALAASLVMACQKNDQSAVQPEKLAEQSAPKSSEPPRADEAPAGESAASAEAAAGPTVPGPLLPYASGKGPADVKPPPRTASRDGSAKAPAPAKVRAPAPPTVKLLDAGQEPRRELRLAVKNGQADKVRMTMSMAIDVAMGAQSQPKSTLPPMVMDMSMNVTETRPNGDIRYVFKLVDTDVRSAPGVDPRVVSMLKEGLGRLNGLGGHSVVTSRGTNREAKIDLGDKASPETQQIMQGMEQAMQQISTPLPEEAVGVGGRWEQTSTLVQQGIEVRQRATYELKKIEGDRVTIAVELSQTAPKQRVAAPGDVKLDLLSLKADGKGTIEMLLTRLAPIRSDLDITSAVEMGMPKNQRMKVGSSLQIAIEGLAK